MIQQENSLLLKKNGIILLLGVFFGLASCVEQEEMPVLENIGEPLRPNIVIILADDLGYSDIGSFGSEINTPNLDQLAENGLKMTRFYNTARCSPTRASLLTGLYPHQAGVSLLDGDFNVQGYRGYLGENTVTIAELLKEAGYKNYLSGKWHVGKSEGQWPLDRGFDRYYGLINGASNFYKNIFHRDPEQKERQTFLLDNEPYNVPETTEEMWKRNEGYHMTDGFTDYALKFLEEHDTDQPFFLYLPYTAPHWPLHAFPKDIDTYRDTYTVGWDSIRTLRYERLIDLGIIKGSTILPPTSDRVDAWDEADEERKKEWTLEMAIFAAMIDHMDRNIGRVIEKLEEMDQMDNTLIIFLSDNGGDSSTLAFDYLDGEPGGPESFPTYGYEGAEVSNVPFRLWKQFIHEGGVATPFIAHYPDLITPGTIDRQVAHLIDLMPTVIDLTGAEYPEEKSGNIITPMQGVSLFPVFAGNQLERIDPIFFEHQGNRGIRLGDWKLVSDRYDFEWELYNMELDPTEMNDLSDEYPEMKQELLDRYETWADNNNVLPYPDLRQLMIEHR